MINTYYNEKEVVDVLCEEIFCLLETKDEIVLGLPGGRSVKGIYEEFCKHKKIPWKKIHIFLVDERLVSITSKDSNFLQIKEQFIDELIKNKIIPEKNIHPFIVDSGKKDYGLADYENELKKFGGYDIVILGTGEDCHIAALFADYSVNNDSEYFMLLSDSPKPPKDRMTASKKLLERTNIGLIIFKGEAKRKAYKNFLNSNLSINKCPAKIVNRMEKTMVLTDLRQINDCEKIK